MVAPAARAAVTMPSTAPTRTVQVPVPVPVPVVAMHNGRHLHHNDHYLQQQYHHQYQQQQQQQQYQQQPKTTSSCLFVASYSITSHITNSYMALQNVHDCHLTIPVTVAAPVASSPVPPTTQLQKMTIDGGGGGGGGGDVTGRSPHPAAAGGAANGNGNTTTTTAYYTATKVGSLHVIDPVTHQHVYLRRVLYVPDFDFSYPIQQLNQLQQQRRHHGLEGAPPTAAGAPPPAAAVIVVLFSVPKSIEDGCLVVDGRQQHEEEMQRLQKRGKMKKTIVGMFGRKTSSKSTSSSSSTSNSNTSNPASSSPSSVDWFEIRRDKFALRFMQNVLAKSNAVSNPEQKDDEDRNKKTNDGEIIYMNVMSFLNPVILSPPMTTHHDHERHHPYHGGGHLPHLAGSLTTSVVGSDIHSQAGCSVSVKSNHSGTSQHLDVNDSSSIVSKSSRTSKKSKSSSKQSSKKPGHRRTNSNASAGNGSHYSGVGSFGGGFGVGGFSNGSASGAARGAGAGGGGFSNGSASGATRGHRRTNSKSQELRF